MEGDGVRGGVGCRQDAWHTVDALVMLIFIPRACLREGRQARIQVSGDPPAGISWGSSKAFTEDSPGPTSLLLPWPWLYDGTDRLICSGPLQPRARREQQTVHLATHITVPHRLGALDMRDSLGPLGRCVGLKEGR